MAKKKLIASVALTAGLLGGGAAGLILGVPGVSGAQTTTVPDNPGTTVPPDRPPGGDGHNCPHMNGSDGQAPSGQSNSNAGFRRGSGTRV